MGKLFQDITTGIDNKTADMGRVSCLFTVAFLSLMVLIDFIITHQFSPTNYAMGVAGLVSGHGALIKLKETTEPQP